MNLSRRLMWFAVFLVASPVWAADPPKAKYPPGFRVVGYLPEYRLEGFDPAIAADLTDLIYFSVEVEPSGALNLGKLKADGIKTLRKAKADHGVALTLCVGGWERSKGFVAMSASPSARKRFAEELVKFCQENDFDGVDLDWEHPEGRTQAKDHATLLKEVHEAFLPHKFQLTMAVAGWQELSPEAIAAVDAVNLMAYDAKGKHSTFEFAQFDLDRVVKKGVPPAKIRLGLPFYGRKVANGSETTYAQIVHKHHPAPDVDEVDGFYFNGPKMIERKTKFALDTKLAGVMIWEVGQDVPGQESLLGAIRRGATGSR